MRSPNASRNPDESSSSTRRGWRPKLRWLVPLLAFCAVQLVPLQQAGVAPASAAPSSRWYYQEDVFLANTLGPNYTEEFDMMDWGNPLFGDDLTWDAPGANGYGWTAEAFDAGLFSIPSGLSTNYALFPITIHFTGAPVTAWGARIAPTDVDGSAVQACSLTITLSNGETRKLVFGPHYRFLGWTGSTPIESVEIGWAGSVYQVPFGGGDHFRLAFWPGIDRFITGSAAP